MRKLVLMFLLFSVGHTYSQSDTNQVKSIRKKRPSASKFWGSDSKKNEKYPIRYSIGSYFDYFTNSNVISNSFVNTFLYKDFIDNSVKDDVTNLMNSKVNRFGVDIDAGIEFKIHPKSSQFKSQDGNTFFEKATKTFRLGQRDFTSLKFTDNFFDLYFRGNKQFAGESIALGPVNYTKFSYQYLRYGVEFDRSEKVKVGAAINLLKGTRFTNVKMPTAQLYTSPDGDSLNFSADIKFAKADNLQPRMSSFQGFGTSFDLYYQKKVDFLEMKFEVNDIGFISWSGLDSFEANSEWAFTGVQINDILNINGDEFNGVETDSLSSVLGIKNEEANRFFILPTKIQAQFTYHRITSLIVNSGIRYYLGAANIPKIWLKTSLCKENERYSNRFFRPSITLAFGGFSKFDAALGIDWSTRNFTFAAQAFYIEPIISPAKTTGQGLSLSLGYNIR